MNATDSAKIESARLAYVALCEGIGSDSVTEETAILSAGREFLPPCAVAVLDDRRRVTVEYYAFLSEETERAQAEHEREVSAGHEWHTDAHGGRTAREVQRGEHGKRILVIGAAPAAEVL